MLFLKKLTDLGEKYAKQKAELQKEMYAVFSEACKEIFQNNDWLESFGWTQYTPYFNDGNECVFEARTYAEDIIINGTDGWSLEDNSKEMKLATMIGDVLSHLPDAFFKELFGDHVQVSIYKNGEVETEYCEHD